ncbi:MAG: RelA/SpoT domain-containing protein [Verrucomicrobiia bacterium]|jgi:ppGpp synthetase/RelA/SpoT-type nucleotidyltranferase
MTKPVSIGAARKAEFRAAVSYYETLRTDFDNVAQILLMHLTGDRRLAKFIHSSKYRTKDPDHLMDKLLRKETERLTEKRGRKITQKNLLKEVDDLAGVRLLHLHTKQSADIHPAILAVLETNKYSLAKKPVVYIWDIENRDFFKSMGIRSIERPEMYTSVHYVITSAQRPELRIELQLRTLMEEVWGEVSHVIDYPKRTRSVACREQLKALARLTSGCTRLVDSIFSSQWEHVDFQAKLKKK